MSVGDIIFSYSASQLDVYAEEIINGKAPFNEPGFRMMLIDSLQWAAEMKREAEKLAQAIQGAVSGS